MTNVLDVLLWAAGWGHFLILVASFQVPKQLKWSEDLPKLSTFNRKLMMVYCGYVVYTIIAFGTFTLVFHREFLNGNPVALGLALFIGLYWTGRLLVDFLYYSHEDWPKGMYFVIGHILLNLLFFFLASVYIGLFLWHTIWMPKG